MKSFSYARSKTTQHAQKQLQSQTEARIKGGGTDLLAQMKRGVYAPKQLVAIDAIPGVRGVRGTGSLLRIGAATRLSELIEALGEGLQGLREAAESTATPGIRNLGTVAGNLLQENRCWYLHDRLVSCPKKDNSKLCPAKAGPSQEHAILGVQNCPSTNSSNLAPMLCALDAQLVLAGKNAGDETRMPLRQLWDEEATRVAFAPRLSERQIVLAIETPSAGWGTAHAELRHKQSYDWATAIAAAAIALDGDEVRDVSLWLGAIAPVPYDASAAAVALRGKAPKDGDFAAVAEKALANAQPAGEDAVYKVEMAKLAIRQALGTALGRARQS